MHLSFRGLTRAAAALTFLALGTCAEHTHAPIFTSSDVAGRYVLESVAGRGPVSGSFTLTPDSRAERHVQYEMAWTRIETVAIGSYELDASGIAFQLREDGGQSPYTWRVRGEWDGSRFSIRHPDPADGPDIVETYRRF